MSPHLPNSSYTPKGRLLQWAAFAVALGISPLFFVGGPGWGDGPLIKSGWDLGHIAFFALLTLAIQPWRRLNGLRLWLLSSLAVLLLSAGIELTQMAIGRQPEWQDGFRNLLGLWAVLALRPFAGLSHPLRWWIWPVRLVILGAILLEASDFARMAVQQYHVYQLPPRLYDFTQQQPEQFWSGKVTAGDTRLCGPGAQNSLAIALTTRRYSGASLRNPPGNWQGYTALELEFWHPGDEPLKLTLRINDRRHDRTTNRYDDRFNQSLSLTPGLNQIRLSLEQIKRAPRSRPMNIKQIRRLMFFTSNLKEPGWVCLRQLRLTEDD